MAEPLPPLAVPMPGEPAVAVLAVFLEDEAGHVLHRNFTTFIVDGERREIPLADGRLARPSSTSHCFSDHRTSSNVDGFTRAIRRR